MITASASTSQKSAILSFMSCGRKRSARQSRISGWIPMARSSLTLCCVGLVFSSCAALIQGTSVTCTKMQFSRPTSWRTWRMASRNGSDSISPTVPPISQITTSTSPDSFFDGGLDFVGDVRNHLHGLAQIIAAALALDDLLVDAAAGQVVRAGERAWVKRS